MQPSDAQRPRLILGSDTARASIEGLTILPDPALEPKTVQDRGYEVIGILCDRGTTPAIGRLLPCS